MTKHISPKKSVITADTVKSIAAQALKSLSANPFDSHWESSAKRHLLDAAMRHGYGHVVKGTDGVYHWCGYRDNKTIYSIERLDPKRVTVTMAKHCDLALACVPEDTDPTIEVADVQVKMVPSVGSKAQWNGNKVALIAQDLQLLCGGHKLTGKKGRPSYQQAEPLVSAVIVLVHCGSDRGCVDHTPLQWLDGTSHEGVQNWCVAPALNDVPSSAWTFDSCSCDVQRCECPLELGTGLHGPITEGGRGVYIRLTAEGHTDEQRQPVSLCCTVLKTKSAIAFNGTRPEGPDLYAFVYLRPDA